MINFPLAPAEGTVISAQGAQWRYKSGRWLVSPTSSMSQDDADARYLRLAGGVVVGKVNMGAAALGDRRIEWGDTGFFVGQDVGPSDNLRGIEFSAVNTAYLGWETNKYHLSIGSSKLTFDSNGTMVIDASEAEGAHITLGQTGGKRAHFDMHAPSNRLRLFHDMGRSAGSYVMLEFTNDGALLLPPQTTQAAGAARRDYVDGVAATLTTSINARLTQAQADALFTTVAENDARYYTKGQGDARYPYRWETVQGTFATPVSRTHSTWYQNPLGRPMIITVNFPPTNIRQVQMADAALGGVRYIGSNATTAETSVTFVLPPGYHWRVNGSAGINGVMEYY